jgi:hypothetical protein
MTISGLGAMGRPLGNVWGLRVGELGADDVFEPCNTGRVPVASLPELNNTPAHFVICGQAAIDVWNVALMCCLGNTVRLAAVKTLCKYFLPVLQYRQSNILARSAGLWSLWVCRHVGVRVQMCFSAYSSSRGSLSLSLSLYLSLSLSLSLSDVESA